MPMTEAEARDTQDSITFAVLTVSSERTLKNDPAGDAIESSLAEEGYEVVTRELVNDKFDTVQRTVTTLISRDDVDAVVTAGGTGVAPNDQTVEAINPLLDKELPGFGELFRSLAQDQVGTSIIGTRSTAGISDGVPLFCLPGNANATKLGTEKIIIPQTTHLVNVANPDSNDDDKS